MNLDMSVFRDSRLSFKAQGIYAHLASLATLSHLTQRRLSQMATDGVNSVRGGINELERYGYLKCYKQRNGRTIWRIKRHDLPFNLTPEESVEYKQIVRVFGLFHIVPHLTPFMKRQILNLMITCNADWKLFAYSAECFTIKQWAAAHIKPNGQRDTKLQPIHKPFSYVIKIVSDGNAKNDYYYWLKQFSKSYRSTSGRYIKWPKRRLRLAFKIVEICGAKLRRNIR